jgi:hypothetical protein
MSFDKPTRNALANMVSECRCLLTEDIRHQLQATYGLQPDGTSLLVSSLGHLDERGHEIAQELREWQEHLGSTEVGTEPEKKKAAFDRLAHETAFTVLNRLAALRMCEERGHVIECVRRGMESDGFVLYERFSGGTLGTRGETYRIFMEHMFDELAVDLGALFDLRAPQSLVFPRERCLEGVLTELNKQDLAHLWKEDETIGWVYQYFNSKEERERMREDSAAPRNSRELAVRNQFFTPRYVVEFLVDNTLGRIWYEMRSGETSLKNLCRYLVRRPTEIFLKQGEEPPASEWETEPQPRGNSPNRHPERSEGSASELLNQPVYIPNRPKKDPRDLKILDPACGSGHFLLYCFDLLETIYEEACADEQPVPSEITGRSLRDEFVDLESLKRAIPELILRHNLHGIDIDLRACQIAALALWLRAQRTYQRLGLKGAERPKITKSNIVCAEPMPGERTFLDQFLAGIEPKVIGQLVQAAFEKMKLAGEAGSLLKIEEEIAGTVAEAKKQWLAGPKAEQRRLFAEDRRPEQRELGLDFSGITDAAFWEKAEGRIYASLKDYAEQAANGHGYQRHLFAEDAARGFAFIDLCHKRYDVILMNPPFGNSAKAAQPYITSRFPRTNNDIYAAFIEEGIHRNVLNGRLGAITSRTGFFLRSFQKWREDILLREARPDVFADLGFGVLEAMVETAAYVLQTTPCNIQVGSDPSAYPTIFVRVLTESDKAGAISDAMLSLMRGVNETTRVHTRLARSFSNIPTSPFAYWIGEPVSLLFKTLPQLERDGRRVERGLFTGDDFRFLRLFWEVAPWDIRSGCWGLLSKGGAFARYYADVYLVVLCQDSFSQIRAAVTAKYMYLKGNTDWVLHPECSYGRGGLTYPLRTTSEFSVRCLPAGCYWTHKGISLFEHQRSELDRRALLFMLGILNSEVFRGLLALRMGAGDAAARSYEEGIVALTPWPIPDVAQMDSVVSLVERAYAISSRWDRAREASHAFVFPDSYPIPLKSLSDWAVERGRRIREGRFALGVLQAQIDERAFMLYKLTPHDRQALATTFEATGVESEDDDQSEDERKASERPSPGIEAKALATDVTSYLAGAAFGRWDVELATGGKEPPEPTDPFVLLPACPPAMLQNEDGLPLTEDDVCRLRASDQWTYPLEIPWDGILVDDPGPQGTQFHRDDIVRRVQTVLAVIWRDRAEAIELEACEILGIKDLREYFRKPALFFADHLKRYSKSRRQAPIYWPLSTASGSYTLWICYHRLNDETLYTALNKFVKPKIDDVEKELRRIESDLPTASGRDASKLRHAFEDTKAFLDELREFRDELLRVAGLPYKPNLNDGVLITASPLWKLFRLPKWRKDLEECWKKLAAGEYDWAHLAYSIWPDRVREVCKQDRSIAIAHGLEELCEVAVKLPKKERGINKEAIEETVVGDEE